MEEITSLRNKTLIAENGSYQYIREPDSASVNRDPHSSADHSSLISPQYLSIQRDIVNASKTFSTLLNSNEFLVDTNGDLITGTSLDQYHPQEYEGDLIHDDLTDDDRKLAAALVAVQLVTQQKQQTGTHILPLISASSLHMAGTKLVTNGDGTVVEMPPLSGPNKVPPSEAPAAGSQLVHPPVTSHSVSNYMQSSAGNQIIVNGSVQPLPPLKKVLSRNRFVRQEPDSNIQLESLGIHQEIDPIDINMGSSGIKQEIEFIMPDDGKDAYDSEDDTEVPDSDYDLTEDNRRHSLPHKKRIAKRLRHPKKAAVGRAGRQVAAVRRTNQQSGCTQTAALKFACELCYESFFTQIKFFEHLKQHYEPIGLESSEGISTVEAAKGSLVTLTESPRVTQKRESKANTTRVRAATSSATSSSSSRTVPANTRGTSSRPQFIQEPKAVTAPRATKQNSVPQKVPTVQFRPFKPRIAVEEESVPSSRCTSVGTQLQDIINTSPSLLEYQLQGSGVQAIWECEPCKLMFRRQKLFETHMALIHQKEQQVEEFSDPEDMMEGIKVYVVSDEEKEGMREVAIQKEWFENDDLAGEDFVVADDGLKSSEGVKISSKFAHENELEELNQAEQVLDPSEEMSHDSGSIQHDANVPASGEGNDNQQGSGSGTSAVHACDMCQEEFLTRKDLNQHISQTHTELMDSITKTVRRLGDGTAKRGSLVCKQCGRRFHYRNSLMYHVRSHNNERAYQCEVCGKGFFARSALKVHMRQHLGVKPFKCEFCSRRFRQWGDLKYHVISIHSDQKNYQCEFCGKDFARKYSLTVHTRIHTGERNYKCEFCGKSFRAASYLQNHRRIHTGEKPHNCEICGKAFRVRSDMKRHFLTHKVGTYCNIKAKEEPSVSSSNSVDSKFMSEVAEVNDHPADPLSISDIAKVEELEVSTVEGILSEETVRATSRLQEDLSTSFIPREGLDSQRESNTFYLWQVFPT